jgi:hypothetical protein
MMMALSGLNYWAGASGDGSHRDRSASSKEPAEQKYRQNLILVKFLYFITFEKKGPRLSAGGPCLQVSAGNISSR